MEESLGTPHKTVLLVDDEDAFREVIQMALEAWGYGVWVAHDGEEALSIIRIKDPQVVLSDVIMPKLDGLSLLHVLKQYNPKIAVILFTAHPSLTDAVSAIKEGATDLLTKPIDFNRLRLELQRLFEREDDSLESPTPDFEPAHSWFAPRKSLPPKGAPSVPTG
jgi:two-component system, NtrC family, response regulator HydG